LNGRELAAWLAALTAVLPVAVAISGPSATGDPWSTMRGCTSVLERMVDCRKDASFKQVVTSWCDTDAVPPLTKKHLQDRLLSWRKPDTRRLSCAIWTSQPGASEQVGERSPLARLAGRSSACGSFNHELTRVTWLRAKVAETP
jgi:hypothetical protein